MDDDRYRISGDDLVAILDAQERVSLPREAIPQRHQRRVLDLLKRFARAEDMELSDHEFVKAVMKRYAAYREEPIIDVGE